MNLPDLFEQTFHRLPSLEIRAPGWVDLLGASIEGCDGLVLLSAIDPAVSILAVPRRDDRVRVLSALHRQLVEIDPAHPDSETGAPWTRPLQGVLLQFRDRDFKLPGLELVIGGGSPLAASLNRESSVTVAFAEACRRLTGVELDPFEMAGLCRAAENYSLDGKRAIFGPLTCLLARRDAVLLIEPREQRLEYIPLEPRAVIVVCDSRVPLRPNPSDPGTNGPEWRRVLQEISGEISDPASLQKIGRRDLSRLSERLPDEIFRRVRHILSENERVHKGVSALREGDFVEFGQVMYESHQSLRDDCRCTNPEVDLMVSLARQHSGAYGARSTATAGRSSCIVALVRRDAAKSFIQYMDGEYRRQRGLRGRFLQSSPVQGSLESAPRPESTPGLD